MIRRRLAACALLAITACHPRPQLVPMDSGSLISRCANQDAGRSGARSRLEGLGLNAFEECWFSEFLTAMNEPALATMDSTVAVYRFLLLPSFAPAEAVRVTRRAGRTEVTYKRTIGAGGYDPQGLSAEQQAFAPDSTWAALERQLDLASFWTTRPDSILGLDGEEWIFEAWVGGRHRLIKAWSPEPAGRGAKMFALGRYFLTLAVRSSQQDAR